MICAIRESDPRHPAENVVACVRGMGERLRLDLPGGGVLEITVDEIRLAAVGLVLSVSKPFVFEDVERKG